jgi:hypothetical protein
MESLCDFSFADNSLHFSIKSHTQPKKDNVCHHGRNPGWNSGNVGSGPSFAATGNVAWEKSLRLTSGKGIIF